MAFNESFENCASNEMELFTNKDIKSYEKIIEMENFNKIGRKVIWIGAQMRIKRKWVWTNYESSEWPW